MRNISETARTNLQSEEHNVDKFIARTIKKKKRILSNERQETSTTDAVVTKDVF